MNPIVIIMLIFAVLGFLDLTFDLKKGLAEEFRTGLNLLPTLLIASVGVSSLGVTLLQNNAEAVSRILSHLPFEPGIIIGTLLAPDLGGLPLGRVLAADPGIAVLNGVVLATLLGQTVSFQIPVFMTTLKKEEHDTVIRGFLIGITLVPIGFLAGSLMLGIRMGVFIREFIPVLILCLILFAGLMFKTHLTVMIVRRLATVITWIIYGLFFVTMIGVFFPSAALVDTAVVAANSLAIVKSCIIAGGALVMASLIRRLFPGLLRRIANKLGINEVSVICLLIGMATSMAILIFFPKMDPKGKLINCAFSVSGAYLLGGQMGYVASFSDVKTIWIYLAVKLLCGFLSIWLAGRLYSRFSV